MGHIDNEPDNRTAQLGDIVLFDDSGRIGTGQVERFHKGLAIVVAEAGGDQVKVKARRNHLTVVYNAAELTISNTQ